jgi:hypothetical protein
MDPLDAFHKENPFPFDINAFGSDDLSKFDTPPPPSLFKYFPEDRSSFFIRPIIRFTNRQGLNDPFELMKRWDEFAGVSLRKAMADHLQALFQKLATRSDLLLGLFKKEQAERGVFLSPSDIATVSQMFLSPEGQSHIAKVITDGQKELPAMVEKIFELLTLTSSYWIENVTSKLGILSLSANPFSRVMWSLYASAGRGFLVEFDTAHSFFRAPTGRHVVWPVNYKDEFGQTFFENPMSLLVTKHKEYFFEDEWRMVKNLNECDEIIPTSAGDMHFCKLPPGSIKSIVFGYNYDRSSFPTDTAHIKVLFDKNVQIKICRVNRETGNFEFHELKID